MSCSQRARNGGVDKQPPAGGHQGAEHQARHQELQLQEQVSILELPKDITRTVFRKIHYNETFFTKKVFICYLTFRCKD